MLKIIEDGQGRWSGYYIWPLYRKKQTEDDNLLLRRNPVRTGDYKFKIGDLPIMIGSVEVGRLVRAVPLFSPEAWNGPGIKLVEISKTSPDRK